MQRNWLGGAAFAAALAAIGGASAAQDGPAPLPRPAGLAAPDAGGGFAAGDLDRLVAPIALYPDALLTQVFVAATYPLDVAKADRFLDQWEGKPDRDRAAAAEAEPWDPSVQVLAGGFPVVIRMMAADLDWTERLGDAVIAQTDGLLDAVQRMRAQAAAAGNLATNAAQVVEVDDGAISVTPADPGKVYVPSYDPAVAFVPAPAPVTVVEDDDDLDDFLMMGAVSFGTALLVNEIWDDDWDDYWGHGHSHIDWDDAEFYPRRDVDIDGDVNIDIDRTRIGDIDRDELRQDRREIRREAGGWEPTAAQRERAQANIERRRETAGERPGIEGLGAAAAGAVGGAAGGALAARAAGGGEARARLEAANARRPPERKFDGASTALQPGKATPVRAAKDRERAAASIDRQKAAKSRPEAIRHEAIRPEAARPKSVNRPAQATKPVRKPPAASPAFKKQASGARTKAAKHRGARSGGGRGGGMPRR